tara:strand:- start:143 stop:1015 length:873 start_codon:yes stop_codon:yes gene_type:complete
MYVGKHIHGKTGRSAKADRWKKHPTDTKCVRLHREIAKYGHESFRYAILEHVHESIVNERERFFISSEGLDTLAPRGLNLLSHDPSNPMSDEARARVSASAKVAQNRPEVKAAKSKRARALHDGPDGPGVREKMRKRMRDRFDGPSGPALREAASKRMKDVMTDDVRAKMRTSAAARWENEQQHEDARKRQAALMAKPEMKEKLSKAAISRFQKPGAIEAHSRQQIRAMRTPQAYANMHAAAMRRRTARLEACATDVERRALEAKFAKRDVYNRNRQAKRASQPPRKGGQ